MSWYWIVLLIFTYIFIGALVFAIMCRDAKNKENPFLAVVFTFASMFWPATLVSLLVCCIVWVVDKLVGKFYEKKEK